MTPLQRYQADLAQGGFRADSDQQHTVELLQSLYKSLHAVPVRRPLWRKLLCRQPAAAKGVYLWKKKE